MVKATRIAAESHQVRFHDSPSSLCAITVNTKASMRSRRPVAVAHMFSIPSLHQRCVRIIGRTRT